MSIVQSIGHPYIHAGVNCDGCGKSPIKGYRYKCQRRPDHDLCGECFRRQAAADQPHFLKIERADKTPPFQIHYVECDACGAAPIHGPRYHHKRHSDYDVCATCYVDVTSATNPHGEPAGAFEMWEQSENSSNRKKHHPTYHFEVACAECQVTPIPGPRYNSIKNFQYDLCLVCFDTLLVNEKISALQFRRIERPDSRSAVHVYIFCCNRCGATPICGPAYLNQTKQSKLLCLMCFLNLKKEKQGVYTRVNPPRQLNLSVSSVNPRPVNRTQSAPPMHHSAPGSLGQTSLQRPGSSGGTSLRGVGQPQMQLAPPMMTPAMQPVPPMFVRGMPQHIPQAPMMMSYPQGQQQPSVGQQIVAEVGANVAGQVVSNLLGMMIGGGENN